LRKTGGYSKRGPGNFVCNPLTETGDSIPSMELVHKNKRTAELTFPQRRNGQHGDKSVLDCFWTNVSGTGTDPFKDTELKAQDKFMLFKDPDLYRRMSGNLHGSTSFFHIFKEEYSSGYYSYKMGGSIRCRRLCIL